MAKSKKTKSPNKSAAIRRYLNRHGDEKPAVIVSALHKRGLEVTAQHVSQIKMKWKQDLQEAGQEVPAAGTSPAKKAAKGKKSAGTRQGEFNSTDLMQAKELIDRLGVKRAQAALDVVAAIRN